MDIPSGILCAKTHEYVLIKDDYAIVGITDELIKQMGEILFIEFPIVDSLYYKKEVFATIEADGLAMELHMPLKGKIIEVNPLIQDSLDLLNKSPLSDGWIVKVEPSKFEWDEYDLIPYEDYINSCNQ
ncbi:glycine cleavage system protein H [bacterium]|nr:glycine cleavage system protein H [bacterium]